MPSEKPKLIGYERSRYEKKRVSVGVVACSWDPFPIALRVGNDVNYYYVELTYPQGILLRVPNFPMNDIRSSGNEYTGAAFHQN
jgi:hypothetical protein